MGDFARQEDVPYLGQVGRSLTVASAGFTRPTNTTPYDAGDLVANSGTAGSVTPLSLTVGRFEKPLGRVKRVRLRKSTTTLTGAAFRAHFYVASPTVANGDNGAWSTDLVASYVGSIGITMDKAFTDGAFGAADSDLGFKLTTGQTLYALIEATAAYTPGNAEVFTLAAEIEQD